MKKNLILEIIVGLIILLFLYTGFSKLMTYRTFNFDLTRNPLIKDLPYVPGILAIFVPLVEILMACFLFFPKTRKVGLYGSILLMSIFTIYVGYILTLHTNIPCTCGGVLRELTWTQHLWFNVLFLLLSILGILTHKKLAANKLKNSSTL